MRWLSQEVLLKQSEGRLSIAALETLAIVAYRQPITAPEVSGIRGVNSSGVIRTLLDRKLEFMRVLAMERIVGNWDSYGYARGKNMFAYKPESAPWVLLPWDVDFVFSSGGNSVTDPLFGSNEPVLDAFRAFPNSSAPTGGLSPTPSTDRSCPPTSAPGSTTTTRRSSPTESRPSPPRR